RDVAVEQRLQRGNLDGGTVAEVEVDLHRAVALAGVGDSVTTDSGVGGLGRVDRGVATRLAMVAAGAQGDQQSAETQMRSRLQMGHGALAYEADDGGMPIADFLPW